MNMIKWSRTSRLSIKCCFSATKQNTSARVDVLPLGSHQCLSKMCSNLSFNKLEYVLQFCFLEFRPETSEIGTHDSNARSKSEKTKWLTRFINDKKNLICKITESLVRGRTWTTLVGCHCQANSAHIRQSWPESGLGFQIKGIQ